MNLSVNNYNSAMIQKQTNVNFQKNACGEKMFKLLDRYMCDLYMVPRECKDSFLENYVNTIDKFFVKLFSLGKKV